MVAYIYDAFGAAQADQAAAGVAVAGAGGARVAAPAVVGAGVDSFAAERIEGLSVFAWVGGSYL